MRGGDGASGRGNRGTPFARHGGALDAAVARYGGERAEWLDLSTGINPVPPEVPELAPEAWRRLPEARDEAALLEAARIAYGAPRQAGVVAAPGTQALIAALPGLFPPTRVAIVEPTYGEHRAAFAALGHEVIGVRSPAAIPEDFSIAVVVNPNNPDGRRFPQDMLLALADRLGAGGGLLVVDEAFMDPEPDESLAGETGRRGLFVYRSFGKTYGLAGLRLGFALCEPDFGERLARRLGPWAVSGPAIAIGRALLGNEAGRDQLASEVRARGLRLRETLVKAGLPIVGATALFATVRADNAMVLHEALCRRRILTRPFAYEPNWLRFGQPAGEAELRRLSEALDEAMGEALSESGR